MTDFEGVFFKEIVEQGLREFPNECCGVIAADANGRPVKVFPGRNIDASAATYRLDTKDQFRIEKEIEASGWANWGFYHSHTHSEAYPSDTDRERSKRVVDWYPHVRFLILSLADRYSRTESRYSSTFISYCGVHSIPSSLSTLAQV